VRAVVLKKMVFIWGKRAEREERNRKGNRERVSAARGKKIRREK